MASGFIILHLISHALTVYKYEIVVQDEELVKPCNNENTTFPGIYFDTSKLKFEILEDGLLSFLGTLEITNGFPENTILEVSLDFYKKHRGLWDYSIYNFQRPDLCEAMFDPTELWYKYTSSIPIEQRKCPLYNGDNVSVTNHFASTKQNVYDHKDQILRQKSSVLEVINH
ncbi:hypothetical protein FF38_07051 [Lucilia cuprina]|uniref:Uncharacterized protein n=1 Tax=Lucilia cuprina TaxID=7375 RepID=A0A0L0CHM2_LUCCU|nr:hypothetical protein FF38_07051 [Lucilia cuprina]